MSWKPVVEVLLKNESKPSFFSSGMITAVAAALTALIAVVGFFGIQKFWWEPLILSKQARRKYATALWITCNNLRLHLQDVRTRLHEGDKEAEYGLMKIPNNDFNGEIAWFTKEGFYATATAYKIAVVSAWLQIYQRELLFWTGSSLRTFASNLYNSADQVKNAFGRGTFFGSDYFDAIGDKMLVREQDVLRPMTFASFCDNYYGNADFRLFFEQLHMFLWFVAHGEYRYVLDEVNVALEKLVGFLKEEKLLTGLEVQTLPINPHQPIQPSNNR